jgi:hypothetical protein
LDLGSQDSQGKPLKCKDHFLGLVALSGADCIKDNMTGLHLSKKGKLSQDMKFFKEVLNFECKEYSRDPRSCFFVRETKT